MDSSHSYAAPSSQEDELFSDRWVTINYKPSESNLFCEETLNDMNSVVSPDSSQLYAVGNGFNIEEVIGTDMYSEDFLKLLVKNEVIENNEICVETTTNPVYQPSSLPASENWPGNYNFNISFAKKTKKAAWIFSESNETLYVGKGIPCPISFSTNSIMPEGVKIRAMALYSSPESASEVVRRCADHIIEDQVKNLQEAEHLVRCESLMASYEIDPVTKRYSVVIPFDNPPAGQDFSTYIFKFVCLRSCPGPNRRPLMIVFTLEKDNQEIGRKKLDIKVCQCPFRDCQNDEERSAQGCSSKKRKVKRKSENSETSGFNYEATSHSTKKIKVTPHEDGYYYVRVKDKKCYEFLEQIKTYYEVVQSIKNMPSDVKNILEQYQKRKGCDLNLVP